MSRQAFPEFSSVEIMEYVIKSSNHFTNPDIKQDKNLILNLHLLCLKRERKKVREKVLNGGNIAKFNPFINSAQIVIAANSGNSELTLRLYRKALLFILSSTYSGVTRIVRFKRLDL